jgi:curved DNA-binding protein
MLRGARQTLTLTRPVVDATAVTTNPHTLHVVIPKGIIEGQRIRLRARGFLAMAAVLPGTSTWR